MVVVEYAVYFLALVLLGVPLGRYMARVYEGEAWSAQRLLGPLERLIYWLCGVRADEEMSWQQYALSVLVFNLFGIIVVYAT